MLGSTLTGILYIRLVVEVKFLLCPEFILMFVYRKLYLTYVKFALETVDSLIENG